MIYETESQNIAVTLLYGAAFHTESRREEKKGKREKGGKIGRLTLVS